MILTICHGSLQFPGFFWPRNRFDRTAAINSFVVVLPQLPVTPINAVRCRKNRPIKAARFVDDESFEVLQHDVLPDVPLFPAVTIRTYPLPAMAPMSARSIDFNSLAGSSATAHRLLLFGRLGLCRRGRLIKPIPRRTPIRARRRWKKTLSQISVCRMRHNVYILIARLSPCRYARSFLRKLERLR